MRLMAASFLLRFMKPKRGSRAGFQNFKLRQDPLPPPALYVALRGLRRSLHKNPDDPQAYLMLGHVYLSLFWQTQEQTRTSAVSARRHGAVRIP